VTILCEPDERAAGRLLESVVGAVRVVPSLPDAAAALTDNTDEDLVVIGEDVPVGEVVAFANHVRSAHVSVGLVLVRRAPDEQVDQAAIDAGVHEVVVGGDAESLRAACVAAIERVGQAQAPASEAESAAGRIVTVFSPKGGSGKTTIATNLSVVLGAAGKRVCLVDLDLEFGDVGISLQLTPVRSLADVQTLHVYGDDEVVAAAVTPYNDAIDCVLAPIEPGEADKVPAELVHQLLGLLRERYDFVVVDTSSHLSEQVLDALDQSDVHVLVANPEIPALKSMRLTLDMLDLLGYAGRARQLVLNRADDAIGITGEEAQQALGVPVLAQVPASRDVTASINRGVPLTASHPDHPVSRAVRAFALDHLVGEPESAARRSGLSRVLRRKSA
jgi:pilus assembly protein CpaE